MWVNYETFQRNNFKILFCLFLGSSGHPKPDVNIRNTSETGSRMHTTGGPEKYQHGGCANLRDGNNTAPSQCGFLMSEKCIWGNV